LRNPAGVFYAELKRFMPSEFSLSERRSTRRKSCDKSIQIAIDPAAAGAASRRDARGNREAHSRSPPVARTHHERRIVSRCDKIMCGAQIFLDSLLNRPGNAKA
jgi:hypothetical protein